MKKRLKTMKTELNKRFRMPSQLVFCLALICCTCSIDLQGQDTLQATSRNNKRLKQVVIGSSAGYTIGMTGLYHLWYKDSERQTFRFFNDNAEWKQVDKIGHFGSAFYMSYGAHRALRWCGADKKSDLIAAAAGFVILLPIEVFDGFSDAYG